MVPVQNEPHKYPLIENWIVPLTFCLINQYSEKIFIYSPSSKAMQEYVKDDFLQGYIHSSTYCAASCSFFVAKKNEG